ncbi:hypothetical protein ACJX0J_009151, partial [Zea mays]
MLDGSGSKNRFFQTLGKFAFLVKLMAHGLDDYRLDPHVFSLIPKRFIIADFLIIADAIADVFGFMDHALPLLVFGSRTLEVEHDCLNATSENHDEENIHTNARAQEAKVFLFLFMLISPYAG